MTIRSAASWAMGAQYASFALQFATSLVLARYFISPEQLGLFSISFAAIGLLATLQDFGVNRYVCGESDLTPEKLQTSYTVSLAISWALALICVLAAWPLATYYGQPKILPLTLVIAASYFLVPFAIVPQALRQRELDFRSSAMITVGATMANTGVSVALGWCEWGSMALACGALAQQAARALIAQWRVGGLSPWPPRLEKPGRVLSFGGTNTVLVTCANVAASAPELMIGRLLGPASAGLYTRATGLAIQTRILLVGAVGGVFLPAFRKIREEGKPLGPPYLRIAAIFSAIMWPALAGLAVLSEPVIHLLYGARWLDSASLLLRLSVAQMFFVSMPMIADLGVLLDRKRELVVRNILDVVVVIALLALSAPFGLNAIATSRIVHGVLWSANFLFFLRRMVGFSWGEWFAVQLRSLALTLLAIAPTLALYHFADGPREAGAAQILASAGAGAVVWAIGLWALRHPAFEELERVAAMLRARVSRRRKGA
ncbi:oligosaccharide flippase family protein [Novosphingobium sp. 1949]|uniref:Oligosaccharide flippase family protein n=1 Tax=Novosphingobium organovorum TaxID=2930092 RepID=A0ABT0BFL2_9SPHN|nr:oligosaccharide flippase family protein [Novosphingobium organovorum]MCJ2183838.1 oligosaccharide flippase family protein [Novosphingobium organovorum]